MPVKILKSGKNRNLQMSQKKFLIPSLYIHTRFCFDSKFLSVWIWRAGRNRGKTFSHSALVFDIRAQVSVEISRQGGKGILVPGNSELCSLGSVASLPGLPDTTIRLPGVQLNLNFR